MISDRPSQGRRLAADALRSLSEDFLNVVTTPDVETEIIAAADRLRQALRLHPPFERDNEEFRERIVQNTTTGDALSHYDECCIDGLHNPFSLRIAFWRDGESVRARARFTRPYEGPTGRVHGGAIAAVYEDVLGYQLTLRQSAGYMATLSIEFLRATPLDQEVEFSSEVVSETDDRLQVVGRCVADGVVTTQARGELIMVSKERFQPFRRPPSTA